LRAATPNRSAARIAFSHRIASVGTPYERRALHILLLEPVSAGIVGVYTNASDWLAGDHAVMGWQWVDIGMHLSYIGL
jgi:hypothetical protein